MNLIAMRNFRKANGGVVSVYCGHQGEGGAIVFVDLSDLAAAEILILPWCDDPQRDRGASSILWQIAQHLMYPTNYRAKSGCTEYDVEFNCHEEFDTLILSVCNTRSASVCFDAEDIEMGLTKEIGRFMRESIDLAGVQEG